MLQDIADNSSDILQHHGFALSAAGQFDPLPALPREKASDKRYPDLIQFTDRVRRTSRFCNFFPRRPTRWTGYLPYPHGNGTGTDNIDFPGDARTHYLCSERGR
jgi:hypothetical protein